MEIYTKPVDARERYICHEDKETKSNTFLIADSWKVGQYLLISHACKNDDKQYRNYRQMLLSNRVNICYLFHFIGSLNPSHLTMY